jgi:peptidyl-dipeptidase Dcp
MQDNPLLQPWSGPLGGVPPLDRVQVEHFEPAVTAAIAEKRAEADAVRDLDAPPTFDNTVAALEGIGSALRRVSAVYYLWTHNFSSPAVREVEQRLAPKLAEVEDRIFQDAGLYARVRAVSEAGGLDPVQRRLVDRYLRSFRKAGAHLDEDARARVSAINQRLSTLFTTFSSRVLADEEGHVTWLSEDQLGGLSPGFIAAAKAAAVDLGEPDRWAVTNSRASAEPFLESSTERGLRQQVWRRFFKRGDNGDENDTKGLITEILALRREKAVLLGYETYAHYKLADTMARTPEATMDLMGRVWAGAKVKFEAEVAAMQALADEEGAGITVAPWDVRYYAQKVKARDHRIDAGELAMYYQLENLREGMFWAATRNFGWTFTPVEVPVPHADFRVWQVNNADGSPRGLFYFDPYARHGKRSGAWMTAYRVQQDLGCALPLVSNNCNYQRGADGAPTLLTADQARTLFHEFGHGMHGLASEVRFPKQAGTGVARDFVEFPSQLNEHWLFTPELLSRFGLHLETGEPPSPELLGRIRAAENADSGFRTMEFLASSVMDMELHLAEGPVDPAAFEDEVLARWGLPEQVVMRHRTPHFAHVFSGEGYAAGYYSYLWADVLVADAAELFSERGFYEPTLATNLLEGILSRGDTVDPAEAYRAFRGREPDPGALLRERGLTAAG